MTTQSENKGEEKQMETETKCPCEGKKCGDATGWIWKERDLGNRITDGTKSHKAGQFWAVVCEDWKAAHGDELPPNPPGISDMSKWMHRQAGGEGRGHSGGGWRGY